MIRFDLLCDSGHEFDSWFRDGNAFDKAKAAGGLACPQCGSAKVEKGLMAPSVSTARAREARAVKLAAPDPRHQAMIEVMRKLRDHVKDNADDVGGRFAEEARKIHYNEAEPRSIYGQASLEEARALAEEGIEFHPLPDLPEEGN